jgi:hypothetical protein
MERLLRRTAREIYKLRKTRTNKGQLDVQSFRFGLYPYYLSNCVHSFQLCYLGPLRTLDETLRIAGKKKEKKFRSENV